MLENQRMKGRYSTMKTVILNDNLFTARPVLIDHDGRILLGEFVGSAEIVVDEYIGDEGRELVTELALLYQLITGEFVATWDKPDGITPHEVFSLKGKMFDIHWGYFPVDFPDAWKSIRRCPKALRHVDMYFEDELNQDNSEESMFRYLVLGYRFDRSGESEEQLEYSGGSRIEALEALRNVRQTGHGDIYIDVRGRNNWSQ